MKAPYIVNYNGTYYKAGEELPEKVAELLKPSLEKREALEQKLKEQEKENTGIKTEIIRK